MTSPPPDFSVRLSAHAQGLHDIQESGRLSHPESNVISEALDIIHLMMERPELSNALMEELSSRERARRNQATVQQASIIWSRVGASVGEAVETARDIGRVSPQTQNALNGLVSVMEHNMSGLLHDAPLIKSLDKLELASQQLRTHSRQAKALFHGKPHEDHDQSAALSAVALAWKTPTSPAGFLDALRHLKEDWGKSMGEPKPQHRPSMGRG